MALLMIDVDHFKSINDRFGHQTGDAVLREAVGRMQRSLGGQGVLGRYGGEEFVVMLPEASTDEATALAEELRHGARQAFPADSPLAAVGSFTVSVGVAPQWPGADIDDMLGQADEALYRAKSQGRDRVVLAMAG
jgi:diguanylate cyclase (GGDEF)-like protein